MRPRRRISLAFLIALLGGSGTLHLVHPQLYEPLIPAFLGHPRPVVYASGGAELLAAALLALPATRRAGAWFTVGLLVVVFPGNVKMALDGGIPGAGFPFDNPVAAWLRLPLQVPLIWWAWTFTPAAGHRRQAEHGGPHTGGWHDADPPPYDGASKSVRRHRAWHPVPARGQSAWRPVPPKSLRRPQCGRVTGNTRRTTLEDPVKTTVERVDETTVKLTVTVEAERVAEAVQGAAAKLASEVKVPGFRPGRVPRRVLETRLGKDTLLQEAARQALPTFYTEAVQSEELAVVSPPEFDVETFTEEEGADFTATVEVRPEFDAPDYAELQIPHPDWELTDEEVTEQLDMLRERFAQLEAVERAAEVGDFLVIDILGLRDGERLDEASGEDLLYELSDAEESDSELDRNLVGAESGHTVEFTDTLGEDYGEELAGVEVDFTVQVKEVKTKKLPEVDDDFAVTATEFDTAEELMDELRSQMAAHKRMNARAELRGKVVEAVAELVDVPLPQAMVQDELRFRLSRLSQQAEQYGMTLEQYVQMAGTSTEDLFANLEQESRKTVKAQLVIDRIGQAEGIEVTGDDLGVEISRQAQRLDRDPEELAGFMTHPDRINALVSDAFRRKTIDHLLASVQVLSAPPDEEEDVITEGGAVEGHDAAAALAAAEAEAAAAEEDDGEE